MGQEIRKTLHRLTNTRDLRAEMLALAADLAADSRSRARLIVADPSIGATGLRDEWQRLLPALAPNVRDRLTLAIETTAEGEARQFATSQLPLERPNFRYEVLRLLIGAALEDDGPQSLGGLVTHLGASQTPVRAALAEFVRAGFARQVGRGVQVDANEVSVDLMSRLRALPQTIKFRFERGARIRSPAELVRRALSLLGARSPAGWEALSLSGTPVALADVPALDLVGTPRLDLVATLPRAARAFDAQTLRLLDDGLEPEPSALELAPVVVTVTRAATRFERDARVDGARCAYPMDVYLALLDLGLREQALHYAKAMRA